MCLKSITSGPEPEAEGVGYKCFAQVADRLTAAILFNKTFKIGEWNVDKCDEMCVMTDYPKTGELAMYGGFPSF
jgi:hypothetical protein